MTSPVDPPEDEERGRTPLDPIPLPPDPLGRWLGPPGEPEEPTDGPDGGADP